MISLHLYSGLPCRYDVRIAVVQVLLRLSGRVVNHACSKWKGAASEPEDIEATDKLGIHTEGASKT